MTSRKIVGMVRHAGAKELHLRISSPPTTGPCHYGINTPKREELIAATHSIAEIASFRSRLSVSQRRREAQPPQRLLVQVAGRHLFVAELETDDRIASDAAPRILTRDRVLVRHVGVRPVRLAVRSRS